MLFDFTREQISRTDVNFPEPIQLKIPDDWKIIAMLNYIATKKYVPMQTCMVWIVLCQGKPIGFLLKDRLGKQQSISAFGNQPITTLEANELEAVHRYYGPFEIGKQSYADVLRRINAEWE